MFFRDIIKSLELCRLRLKRPNEYHSEVPNRTGNEVYCLLVTEGQRGKRQLAVLLVSGAFMRHQEFLPLTLFVNDTSIEAAIAAFYS